MTYKTHVMGGILSGIITLNIISKSTIISPEGGAFIAGSIMGSLFPDIDHRGSYIGKRAKITSTIVNKTLGHRGATHSPLIIVVLTGILYILSKLIFQYPLLNIGIIGFFVGATSHILLDSFTKRGVPLLYPFSKRKFSLLHISTGGTIEHIIFFVMIIASGYLIAKFAL